MDAKIDLKTKSNITLAEIMANSPIACYLLGFASWADWKNGILEAVNRDLKVHASATEPTRDNLERRDRMSRRFLGGHRAAQTIFYLILVFGILALASEIPGRKFSGSMLLAGCLVLYPEALLVVWLVYGKFIRPLMPSDTAIPD
jgi:hypothetical protein